MGKNGEKKVMMIPNKIIIHCSATPRGVDYSAADIDKWHRQRGFSKVGYHYVIRLDDDQVIDWEDSPGPIERYGLLAKLISHMENDPLLGDTVS